MKKSSQVLEGLRSGRKERLEVISHFSQFLSCEQSQYQAAWPELWQKTHRLSGLKRQQAAWETQPLEREFSKDIPKGRVPSYVFKLLVS